MTCCIVVIARRTLPSQPGEVGGDLDEVGVSIGWVCLGVCVRKKRIKSITKIINNITSIHPSP